jgi:hypothetical protein
MYMTGAVSVSADCQMRIHTSLSRNLASIVICFITRRGTSSESLEMNDETDLGPRRSLLLNSFPLSSLFNAVRMTIYATSSVSYLRISSESCG